MAGNEAVSEDFNKQLLNLVNSLIAIAPSRNLITQFLYVLRMNGSVDYGILEDAYPNIVKNEYIRENISKAFGVSFTDKITLEHGKYGYFLTDFIEKVFQLFENSEFRSKIGNLLRDEYEEGIPNLAREWLEVRLKGLSSDPTYGSNALRVLKEIMRVGRTKTEELEKTLNVERGTLIQCLSLLDLYKVINKDYNGSYRPSEFLKRYADVLERM
jgi:hypothetical protein